MQGDEDKRHESGDPFGTRSAIQRKMVERGDDPASRARAEAEAEAERYVEVTDAEIAELLSPSGSDDADGPGDAAGTRSE